MSTGSVEVVYRGVFQKKLAKNICRGVVLAARKEGKVGIAFGRYSDSPERNGIPAKQFAVVADSEEELQAHISRYEPDQNDVTIVCDDTLCKGVESWAWNGLQPVHHLLRPDGVLLLASQQKPDDLVAHIEKRETPYRMAVLPAQASFSGMFIYRDDLSDVRLLGALAKAAPHIVTVESVGEAIADQWNDDLKVAAAKQAHDSLSLHPIAAGVGNGGAGYHFDLPGWKGMEECLVIRGVPEGGETPGRKGGFTPGRNATFKKFATRTLRPVINFATCKKCTLCWLQCPDTAFDLTPDGLYDANLEACCGCGVCEAVCPVKNCITMVNEGAFHNNDSQWESWTRDPKAYAGWLDDITAGLPPRSHGFHHVGQYAEEVAQ